MHTWFPAYIDGGSSSYLFQLAIASLVGVVYTLKVFWKNITRFFARLFSPRKSESREP